MEIADKEIYLSPGPTFPAPQSPWTLSHEIILPLWKVWPSKNRFFLNGRIMIGPKEDQKYLLCTWALLASVSIFYFIFISPYLWITISPILPIIAMYCFLSSMVFIWLTTTTEPGIIPKKPVWEVIGTVPEEFTEAVLISQPNRGYKYCPTCKIYRPPRSHHCKNCGNCVEDFDHHCRFLDNCIGKRNYRWFMSSVFSSISLGVTEITGFLFFLFYNVGEDHSRRSLIEDGPTIICIVVIITLFSLIITVFVSILCIFHMTLCITGESTKERIKGIKAESKRSCCRKKRSYFDRMMLLNSAQIRNIVDEYPPNSV
ncbi:unnamed protein product [Blepharisma stoltei]|uniref:Palmitoyltransferase n=1 Tax=Blepharisma stoltei TaxID=1481888 RepID=A0AAU9IMM3_9CILI|nr:unnamed protein product [Blepharisma stoltei]